MAHESSHPKPPGLRRLFFLAGCIACTALTVGGTGCRPSEDVSAYDAPKPEKEPRGKNRILAFMLAQPEKVWYIKLTGPTDVVEGRLDEFVQFIQSVQFKEGKPTWTKPAGWPEPESKRRVTSFKLGAGEKGAEVAVFSIPTAIGDSQLLETINRWRLQLGRRPVPEDLVDSFTADVTDKLKIAGVKVAYRVDLTGPALFAADEPPEDAENAAPSFKFKAPAGWVETKKGSPEAQALGIKFEAMFKITEGKATASVTVTTTETTGTLLSNVRRWGDQVGLPPITEDQLPRFVREVRVDETPGQLADLLGPPGPNQKRTLAVLLKRKDGVWFFKIIGPADLVGRQEGAFKEFLESVQFEGGR